MQGTRHFHHHIGKPVLSVAKHLLEDPSALGSADTMLHHNPKTRERPVEKALSYRQFFALGLLFGLLNTHAFGRIALKTGVLKQQGGKRIADLLGISHLLIMNRAGSGRTQIDNLTPLGLGEQQILVRVRFFSRCSALFERLPAGGVGGVARLHPEPDPQALPV